MLSLLSTQGFHCLIQDHSVYEMLPHCGCQSLFLTWNKNDVTRYKATCFWPPNYGPVKYSSIFCCQSWLDMHFQPFNFIRRNFYYKLRKHFRCSTMTKGNTILFTYIVVHGMKHFAWKHKLYLLTILNARSWLPATISCKFQKTVIEERDQEQISVFSQDALLLHVNFELVTESVAFVLPQKSISYCQSLFISSNQMEHLINR